MYSRIHTCVTSAIYKSEYFNNSKLNAAMPQLPSSTHLLFSPPPPTPQPLPSLPPTPLATIFTHPAPACCPSRPCQCHFSDCRDTEQSHTPLICKLHLGNVIRIWGDQGSPRAGPIPRGTRTRAGERGKGRGQGAIWHANSRPKRFPKHIVAAHRCICFGEAQGDNVRGSLGG